MKLVAIFALLLFVQQSGAAILLVLWKEEYISPHQLGRSPYEIDTLDDNADIGPASEVSRRVYEADQRTSEPPPSSADL